MFFENIRPDTVLTPPSWGVREQSKPSVRGSVSENSTAFGAMLQQQIQESQVKALTFSGHALQRLQQRQISLTREEFTALNEAAAKARVKGARETLILAAKAAFVVSVTNNTVITVMDRDSLKDNVFTQIDSAIVI